ncbi:unnamed protein product [Musa acuminata var. zebrina]
MEEEGGGKARPNEEDEEATSTMEARPSEQEHVPEIDAAESEEKHQRYEALYSRRLRAKYFSKKALDGGDIYGHETTIDNEIIKSSRWPCTRSFADPIKYMEDQNQSSSEAETNATTDKNQEPKKSC